MADIQNILNAETGLSVRAKLNEVIARINSQGGETLKPENVEVYSQNKIGGYLQGTIVAYSSATSGFETPKLYRALVDIPKGQSPEDYPTKWFNEGDEFQIVTSNTSTGIVDSLAELRAVEGMNTGDTMIVFASPASWYRFDSAATIGEAPNDGSAGRWVYKGVFDHNLFLSNRNSKDAHNIASITNLESILASLQESDFWEPETIIAATTEHPRWDDSGDPNIYGIDELGFGALPAGSRAPDSGLFVAIGVLTDFWSLDADTAIYPFRRIEYNLSSVNPKSVLNADAGKSIRLVRPYAPADGGKIDGRILYDTFSDYDGNLYDGVIIGDQVWSTTNLKTTSYADGTPIPTGYNDTDWSNLTTGAYAVYDYTLVSGIDSEAEMIAAYGLLYNWYAVDNPLGLATNGTVPTDAEFTQLTDYIIATYPEIDSTNIGDALKSIRQVNSPYIAESDEYIKPKIEPLSNTQRKVKDIYIDSIFTASFSFTGIESFKQVFGRDLSITSATIAPDITDLKVGKNGSTPVTITFPYTIASADVIEFAATYDRESDSYFTLIGKEV